MLERDCNHFFLLQIMVPFRPGSGAMESLRGVCTSQIQNVPLAGTEFLFSNCSRKKKKIYG